VAIVDGDGRQLVQAIARRRGAAERVAVIFDGEKRQTAYETFRSIKGHLTLGVFDDTNLDRGAFPLLLRNREEVAWHTWDCSFLRAHNDSRILEPYSHALRRQVLRAVPRDPNSGEPIVRTSAIYKAIDQQGRPIFHGGMEDLSRFHLSIVQGGVWG